MTTSQLEAILNDQALGELPAENEALLNAYLEASPARHGEARALRESLGESLHLTGEVVARCPELFAPVTSASPAAGWLPLPGRPWPKMAAVFLALALAAGAGYRTGRDDGGQRSDVVAEKTAPASSSVSPWARYVVAADGRLAVVPVVKPGS
jgi:hypothetical protein